MTIDVAAVSKAALAEYARIPIAFEVKAVLDIAADYRGEGVELVERRVETAYWKDYDALGTNPTRWPSRFDTSQWRLMIARIDGVCVGGAAVAWHTSGLDMLEGRSDLAVLWDIRVLPANRRQGIGAALFRAVEVWALAQGCRQLKVETQNINVAPAGSMHGGAVSFAPFTTASTPNARPKFSCCGTRIWLARRSAAKPIFHDARYPPCPHRPTVTHSDPGSGRPRVGDHVRTAEWRRPARRNDDGPDLAGSALRRTASFIGRVSNSMCWRWCIESPSRSRISSECFI